MILMASGYALYANSTYEQWPSLVVHILLFLVAMACFVISAAASAMQLYQRHLMKARSARLFSLSMPAIETLNRVAKRAALVGFPLFTLGMLIGFRPLRDASWSHGCTGVPRRFFLSLAAHWAVSCGLDRHRRIAWHYRILVPHVASSKVRSVLSICGFLGALLLMFVTAG